MTRGMFIEFFHHDSQINCLANIAFLHQRLYYIIHNSDGKVLIK